MPAIASALLLIASLAASDAASAAPQEPRPDSPFLVGEMSREELAGRAEVMVLGVVESIEISREIHDHYEEFSFLATLRILRVEVGPDLSVGDQVKVQYWSRRLDRPIANMAVGYSPLPRVGDEAWLFARAAPERPEVLNPIMPNGWWLENGADRLEQFGGVVVEEFDYRTPPLWPWGIAFIAAAFPPLGWSLRSASQSKGPLRLLSAGLVLIGVTMLFL